MQSSGEKGEWVPSLGLPFLSWVGGGRARSTFTDSHLRPLVTHSTCAGRVFDLYFLGKETETN